MTKMLLARFKLDLPNLANCQVARLPFEYNDALDGLLGFVRSQDMARQAKKYAWEFAEYPTYERLNDILLASAPSFIHGFRTYGETQVWPTSGLKDKPRHALALVEVNGTPTWKPDIDQINDLVFTWADQWARETFKVQLYRGGEQCLEDMRIAIYGVGTQWEIINASELWKNYVEEEDNLVWSTLSSIVAALFATQMAGKSFTMSDGDKEETITWQLTQEGNNQLAVVSEPFHHGKPEEGEGRGIASYKLEFVLQTVAGSTDPWIAVFVTLRRFADRQVTGKNYGRDVTVLLSSATDRKKGWTVTPTWVRLRVKGWIKKAKKDKEDAQIDEEKLKGLYWAHDAPQLWNAWNPARALPDPNELFKTGGHPFSQRGEDRFLILHAEGMEYASAREHGVKSGTGLAERKLLVNHVLDVMKELLTADTAIEIDPLSTITPADIFEKQLWALYTTEDLDQTKAVPIDKSSGQSAEQQRHVIQRRVTDIGLARVLGSKPINLIVASEERPARQVLCDYIDQTLFLTSGEEPPPCVCITQIPLDHDLNVLPDIDLTKLARKEKEKKIKQLQGEWEAKVRSWKAALKSAVMPEAHNIALIELVGNPKAITDAYTWRKTAVRRAVYEVGSSSQFVLSIPPKMAGNPSYFATTARSRVIRAVHDAVIRQTGLTYGSLPALYHYAGLGPDRAEKLVIVALYRHRSYEPQKADYPFCVEMHPDGRMMVVLPDLEGNPQAPIPYVEAAPKIAALFSKPMGNPDNRRAIHYRSDQHDERLMTFAKGVIAAERHVPTLILMEADAWRQSYLRITTNPSIVKDEVVLSGTTYKSKEWPNTALLRIREAGTLNETPQFIAEENPTWDGTVIPIDSDGMMGAFDERGTTMHFYSVARQSMADQDNEDFAFGEGGDTAFKHQKIIEMVPWFAQDDEDRRVFCRIAHLLRFTPGWNRGNTVRPLPAHLARTLMQDVSDVFMPRLS